MSKFLSGMAILLALCSLSQFTLADKIYYKWKDENGNPHFTEKKPKGIKAEKVVVKSHTGSKSVKETAKANETKDQKEEQVSHRSEAEKVITKDKDLCKRAKSNANILKTKPIVRQNNKVLTIQEKNDELKKLNDIIGVHC